MLEAALHEHNSFVTLTYDDEHVPQNLSVDKSEIQLFLKRVRKAGFKVRYYAVGEYGDVSERPHYHLALFGFQSCDFGITRKRTAGCCPQCDRIRDIWGKGQVMLAPLEPQSAAYVCGYVVKKMTKEDDIRLNGRAPEFGMMSLRPGLGLGMIPDVASTLLEHNLDTLPDVPFALQHGTKKWPLGRYLRQNLRKQIGRDKNAPQATLDKLQAELCVMRDTAWRNKEKLSKVYMDQTEGRRIQINARAQRTRKRGTL